MNKRILIDATNVNISIPGGGSFCTKAYIEAFLALFPDRIDVLHPQEAGIRDKRYRTIDVPRRTRLQQIAGVGKGYFHRAAPFIVDYLRQNKDTYQTVLISTGLFAGGVIADIHALGMQVIVLHHNYEPEYRIDSKSVLTLKGRTDILIRHWERKGYLHADINLFLTQDDLNRFGKEYGYRTNNYVTGIFEPTQTQQELQQGPIDQSAVITCALSDIQNQAPLMRFAEHYLPVFENTLPDWKIRLMGRNPSETIYDMADKHDTILLIPNPEDIRSLAAESAIYLCPMDAGGGLKLRIMDGLRSGQPVLVHERSARGYDALLGTPYFYTYHDPASFEQGLRQLIRYMQSADYSREKIQDKHYETFGLEVGIERLRSILCK